MITQRLKLNLIPGVVLPRMNVVQYDKGSRDLEFEIWNGEQRFTLTSQMSARIQGTKSDRHGFDYAAEVNTTNNIVVADLTQQMTAAKGDAICEIVLNKGEERIGSLNFVLNVQPAALSDDTDMSDTDLPDIIALATEQMLTAEAYAKGTRDGVPVTSGQPGYHDNSKYYKEQAADSATDAANSASAAEAEANSAEAEALKAEGYAIGTQNSVPQQSGPYFQNNSKYYSEQAAGSADEAEDSADDASDSAAAALLSEQNAKASEDILQYYVDFVIPRFVIANNRLYISNASTGEFIVANNRLYIKNPT